MKRQVLSLVLLSALSLTASAQKYHVSGISRTRILIDDRYAEDKAAADFLAPYRHVVDSVMSPVVGHTAHYMGSRGHESELSNLLSDIMVWCGTKYGEQPDLGFYNLGGIRAALPEGTITFGDVNDVAPFENKIYFCTLTGEQLLTLFRQICAGGGSGVSKGVRVECQGKELVSVTLNGEPIAPERKYRIATLDYVAISSADYQELRKGTDVHAPSDEQSNTRYLIAEYFREQESKGVVVECRIEGRYVVNR